ncbi:MAG: NAD(P)-dependent oxidoreductase [Alphaproteobacteria bacterium]
MPVSVAMYDKSYEHIGDRLKALNLDIDVYTFDKNSKMQRDGAEVSPGETDIDYVWLSSHLNPDNAQKTAFDMVMSCKSVGVMQTFNAGLDNPVYKKISDKGARICNSSAQAVAISEYVMAHVLSVIHPIDLQRQLQADLKFEKTPFREVSRTNWLIIGYGPIGEEVAKRAKAFGATVDVVRRSPKTSDLVDRAGTMADLGKFLPDADVIILACALNNETRGFADAGFFGAVKEGALLVNVARGKLIDDAAMMASLDSGGLSMAVLDVFHTEPLPTDDPLWTHPKIRMTGHTSFFGDGGRARWDQLFLDNVARFVAGDALEYEVNPADIV